tara:strand:- start:1443 stop:2075 length:633 start_codon:yes stop_codon:yes gene_type:complete
MGKSTSNPARAVATSPAWAVTGRGAGGKVYPAWEERVASGPDDGYWDDMMGFDNSSVNTVVSTDEYGTQMENSFFRFASVEVFKDATITEATLELIMASGASYSFDMAVKGEDVDDSVQYTGSSDASSAANTTASVTWTGSGSWAADEVVQSPDIKTIITEITGRSGWSSGNALTLRLFYTGLSGQDESYSFKTYDSSSSVAAKLTIKYS